MPQKFLLLLGIQFKKMIIMHTPLSLLLLWMFRTMIACIFILSLTVFVTVSLLFMSISFIILGLSIILTADLCEKCLAYLINLCQKKLKYLFHGNFLSNFLTSFGKPVETNSILKMTQNLSIYYSINSLNHRKNLCALFEKINKNRQIVARCTF